MEVIVHHGRIWGVLILLADIPPENALAEYKKILKNLKEDDESGFTKLLEFCKKNGLKKEEEIAAKCQRIIYKRDLAKLTEKPTVKGYQQLLDMCVKNNWQSEADRIKQEIEKCEYNAERAKIPSPILNHCWHLQKKIN